MAIIIDFKTRIELIKNIYINGKEITKFEIIRYEPTSMILIEEEIDKYLNSEACSD